MKRIIAFLLFSFFLLKPAFSQVPSQKEMQAQMKEMKSELNKQIIELEKQITDAKKNKENPETIKELEDQLSMLKKQVEMMGGVSKGISKVSDKTFQQAVVNDNNMEVPKKDVARIKQLPDKVLTDAELVVFVNNLNVEVAKKISPIQLEQAQIIYNRAKEKKQSAQIGNLASLCWMNNYTELALYFAGKACLDDMKNPDHLNNYASFLSMTGGEHLALPILQNLDQKYPGNSTVLNNIAQSWFGLGDIQTAKQFIDKTQMIFPGHPQAMRTKCMIQRSEGQTQEAIESMKESIGDSYDGELEAELEKLGGKLKYDDLPFRYPIKAEPLGIERFIRSIPDYPLEGGETAERSWLEWYDFKQKVIAAREALEPKIAALKLRVDAYHKSLLADPRLLLPFNNKIHLTAKRKQLLLAEWGIEKTMMFESRYKAVGDSISKWKSEYDEVMKVLVACGARKDAATTFLSKANGLLRQIGDEAKIFQKQMLNAQANLSVYTSTDQSEHELAIASMKHGFLSSLYGLHCWFEVGCIASETPPSQGRVLPDFDSVNCNYKTELSIPYMEKTFSIKVECNRMITKFDLPFIKAEIQERLNTNKKLDIVKGSVEISTGFSKDIPIKGPLSAEMELKIGAFVEIGNNQITEVGITGEISTSTQTQNLDKSITMEDGSKYSVPGVSEQKLELGVSSRSSWNVSTGNLSTTVSSTGLFGGSTVSFK